MLKQRTLLQVLQKIGGTSPVSASRAAIALDILLEGIITSPWQEVAWVFSRLTGDGFPVEFVFSSADDLVRYTTEVGGPELEETQKLAIAEEKLVRLGSCKPSSEISEIFHSIQEIGPLKFGSWIGGRHGNGKDYYKLYIEVPKLESPKCNMLINMLPGDKPILPDHRFKLQMIGYEPESLRTELYFKIKEFEPWELGLLLHKAGIEARQPDLLKIIEEIYGFPIERALAGSTIGFSYSMPANGGKATFSMFKYARSVFGSDCSIRKSLLALGTRKGWDIRSYTAVSEPLDDRTGWNTWHGMIAFTVPPEGLPSMSIGLRPPEV